MMRRQLTGLHEEQREPVAALWASEGGIYGRFGYGVAARQLALVPGARTGCGSGPGCRSAPAGSCSPSPSRPARTRRRCTRRSGRPPSASWPGPARWGDRLAADPAAQPRRRHRRAARAAHRAGRLGHRIRAVPDEGQRTAAAATTARSRSPTCTRPPRRRTRRSGRTWPASTSCPTSTGTRAPLDDPLLHLARGRRGRWSCELYDSLWVRLADVGRAPGRAGVLDSRWTSCWTCGTSSARGTRGGGGCPATESARSASRRTDAADLALSSTELGAAYLGGPTLAGARAAAGLVTELRPGRWRRRAGRSPATGRRGARRSSDRLCCGRARASWVATRGGGTEVGRGRAGPVAAPAARSDGGRGFRPARRPPEPAPAPATGAPPEAPAPANAAPEAPGRPTAAGGRRPVHRQRRPSRSATGGGAGRPTGGGPGRPTGGGDRRARRQATPDRRGAAPEAKRKPRTAPYGRGARPARHRRRGPVAGRRARRDAGPGRGQADRGGPGRGRAGHGRSSAGHYVRAGRPAAAGARSGRPGLVEAEGRGCGAGARWRPRSRPRSAAAARAARRR